MTKEEISTVEAKCLSFLTNDQLAKLDVVLKSQLINSDESINGVQETNGEVIQGFLNAKKVEGCSERTIHYYGYILNQAFSTIEAHYSEVTADILREYLNGCSEKQCVSKCSIDNIRRVLSSFFAWLEEEDRIMKSPMRRIHKIRADKTIKSPFTDDEAEQIKDSCFDEREEAVIGLLLSTGMRVGELSRLKIKDISLDLMECVVLGKGAKERIVYFDSATKLKIERYLSARNCESEHFLVSKDSRHKPLKVSGIERIVKTIGERSGIEKCYPHRFRRTLATKAIAKGIPIEQVQVILGHTKIETTLRYAIVEQSNVRNSYRRLF